MLFFSVVEKVQSVKTRLTNKDPAIMQIIQSSYPATSQNTNSTHVPPPNAVPPYSQQTMSNQQQQHQSVHLYTTVDTKHQNLKQTSVPMGIHATNNMQPSTQQPQISIPFATNPTALLPSVGMPSIHGSLNPSMQNAHSASFKPPNTVNNVPNEQKPTGLKLEYGVNKFNGNASEQNQDLDLIMDGNLAILQSEEGIAPVSETLAEGSTVDPATLNQERISSRQLMRDSLSTILVVPNKMDDELWKIQNVVSQEMLLKILGRFNCVRMSSATQKFLLEAIQQHLKTILESAVEISRKRLNRSASCTFSELRNMIIEGDGIIDGNQSTVALKWGPPINEVIRKEDTEARTLLRKYNELNEKYVKEKMSLYDQDQAKSTALKKRTVDAIDEHWWDGDVRMC